jgi:hypothetical protein
MSQTLPSLNARRGSIASLPLHDFQALQRANEDTIPIQSDVSPGRIPRADNFAVDQLKLAGISPEKKQFTLLIECENAISLVHHGPVFTEHFLGRPSGLPGCELDAVQLLVSSV